VGVEKSDKTEAVDGDDISMEGNQSETISEEDTDEEHGDIAVSMVTEREVSPSPPPPEAHHFTFSPDSPLIPAFYHNFSLKGGPVMFERLDINNTGFARVIDLQAYWEQLGIQDTRQVLSELGFPTETKEVDIRKLSTRLLEDIAQYHDIARYPTVRAGLISLQHEAVEVKEKLESLVKERDKVKGDLLEANLRTERIVKESEELTDKQERETQDRLKITEQRWNNLMNKLKLKAELERDDTTSKIEELQWILQEKSSYFKKLEKELEEKIESLKEENKTLLEDNINLKNIALPLEQQVGKTGSVQNYGGKSLENVPGERKNEESEILLVEIENLKLENRKLLDKNDEIESKMKQIPFISHGKDIGHKENIPMIENKYLESDIKYNELIRSNTWSITCQNNQDRDTKDFSQTIPRSTFTSKPLIPKAPNIDDVKGEIIKILCTKENFSKENKILKTFETAYQQLKQHNEELKRKLTEIDPFSFHDEVDCYKTLPDIIITDKKNRPILQNSDSRSSPDGQERNYLIEGKKNEQQMEEVLKEKSKLEDKNRQLEESLSLMNSEFESMENYWQEKLSDERTFYEDQLKKNEEQFTALEARMKDYEELIEKPTRDKDDSSNLSNTLTVIDERREEEEQINVWEQEIDDLKNTIIDLEETFTKDCESKETQTEHFESIGKAESEELKGIKDKETECMQKLLHHIKEDCQKLMVKKKMLEDDIRDLSIKSTDEQNTIRSPRMKEKSEDTCPTIRAYQVILSDIDREKSSLEKELSLLSDRKSLRRLQERLGHQVNRCSQVRADLVRQRGDQEQKTADLLCEHERETAELEEMVRQSQNLLLQQNRKFMQEVARRGTATRAMEEVMNENTKLTKKLNSLVGKATKKLSETYVPNH